MTAKLKLLAPEIFEAIKKANNILLHLHPNPDFDSMGGALGMYHTLKTMGKKAVVIKGDSPLPNFAKYFPGCESIVSKNFFETDLSLFDLFIILDSPVRERISEIGEVVFPKTLKTILIDHHVAGEAFANLSLADDYYPATCQMAYELFAEWGIKITKEAAVCLFVGMYYDTGGFKYEKTNKDTFLAAANLAEIAPDFSKTIFQIENNREREEIIFQGMALNSIESFLNNTVGVSSVSAREMIKRGIKEENIDSGSVANIIKSATGWQIGVALTEKNKGNVRISFRTRNSEKYDMSKIANLLGGGGHKAAAGAAIQAPLAEAQKMVIEAIAKTYPKLGAC